MLPLETAIVVKSRELLAHLEELMDDTSGEVENQDINSAADYIYSLVDLTKIENSGMSEELRSELNQVHIRTKYLLQKRLELRN